jgi:hypothetical protein
MRQTVIALCLLSLAAPAMAAARANPGTRPRIADGQPARNARPERLTAETSANGVGWKQFVTASDGGGVARPDSVSAHIAPELTSWALMVSGIGLAGSLLRRGSLRKI